MEQNPAVVVGYDCARELRLLIDPLIKVSAFSLFTFMLLKNVKIIVQLSILFSVMLSWLLQLMWKGMQGISWRLPRTSTFICYCYPTSWMDEGANECLSFGTSAIRRCFVHGHLAAVNDNITVLTLSIF